MFFFYLITIHGIKYMIIQKRSEKTMKDVGDTQKSHSLIRDELPQDESKSHIKLI